MLFFVFCCWIFGLEFVVCVCRIGGVGMVVMLICVCIWDMEIVWWFGYCMGNVVLGLIIICFLLLEFFFIGILMFCSYCKFVKLFVLVYFVLGFFCFIVIICWWMFWNIFCLCSWNNGLFKLKFILWLLYFIIFCSESEFGVL